MKTIQFTAPLAPLSRKGAVNVEWVIAGAARAEAAALAKFDAAWESAHAEFITEGKCEWPTPPVIEREFKLPFAPERKGKRKHGKKGSKG